MELSQAHELLNSADLEITEENRLGNDKGTQLRLENGVIINIYDTGTCVVQAKKENADNKEMVQQILNQESTTKSMNTTKKKTTEKKDVFIVYGHDTTSRTQLDAMLRRWGLNPLFLDQLPTEGQTVIEKLESAINKAPFGIVLATPDDKGYSVKNPDQENYRARQNVVLELGMLLAKLGRKNVAILLKDPENIERPSDIEGLIYIPFGNDLAKDASLKLAQEMTGAGYSIDISDL